MILISAHFNLNYYRRGNDTNCTMVSTLLPVKHIHPTDSLDIVDFAGILG